jgi:flagellar biosynthesis GTPase FlhF
VLADLGAAPRSLAVAGPAGSGKTAAVANLAVAYAAAGARVAVFALGDAAGRAPLAARLEPLGIPGHVATDAAAVRAALDRATPDVALVDTPALRPGDDAAVAVLADALRRVAVEEVHLALPATSSPAAADEVLTALRPLGLTHAALTHADATGHPGAAVEALIGARLALSYCCTRATVQPADPADVAERLL